MIFSLPTQLAKRLTSQDNKKIMQFYDQVFDLYHQLRGSNVSAEIRRRYAPSIQIWEGAGLSAGCGESGCFIDHIMNDYSSIDTTANDINPGFLSHSYVTSVSKLVDADFNQIWSIWGILHEFGKR